MSDLKACVRLTQKGKQRKIASPIQPIESLAIGTSFSFPHSTDPQRQSDFYNECNPKQKTKGQNG